MEHSFATDFLTPKSGFWIGLGSVVNIGGSYFLYNFSKTSEEADARGLAADWYIVGQDIAYALKHHADQNQPELPLGV
jgi:hypothetical protein